MPDTPMPATSAPRLVVLMGAPGAGKSTVGALLAQRLGVAFVDVDEVIEQRSGRTIAAIFADDGEPAFRALEEATTAELLTGDGVLALGGGAILSESTRARLAEHHVVWLQVGAARAVSRVGIDASRPLLLGNVRGRLIKLLNERHPLYAAAARHTVATDDLEADEVVELIMATILERATP